MARNFPIGKRWAGASLVILSLLALAACDGNGNPPNRATLRVDLASLSQQLGATGGYTGQSIGQGSSPATTPVSSLLIGPVVVTFTSDPITVNSTLTDTLVDSLASDVQNSIAYFRIEALPSASDTVEFDLPPEEAGGWQMVAIATSIPINSFDNLVNSPGSAIYYGFDGIRRRTADISSSQTVTINMQRACLNAAPPLGCAQFLPNRTGTVVTAGVEIQGVTDANGTQLTYPGRPFPWRVRADGGPGCSSTTTCSPTVAQTQLFGVITPTTTSITVHTTHALGPNQPAGCDQNMGSGCTQENFVTTFSN